MAMLNSQMVTRPAGHWSLESQEGRGADVFLGWSVDGIGIPIKPLGDFLVQG